MAASRSGKALLNTISGFADEFVTLICGLILPRLILQTFGSSYNGITSSITQFISCISLMKAGIGGVTKAALYKPLSKNNIVEISAIVSQTERFMRKIALYFVVFVIAFSFVYPFLVNDEFDWLFSSSLIIIISLSTFAQYYFGLTYQMVLNADQKQWITTIVNMVSTILNTIVSVILISVGFGIHIVKLGSAMVFVLGPVFLHIYTKKKYKLVKITELNQDLIKQRWDALGHEIANFVNNNTDIMVLTVFSSLGNVSVYTVYHMVVVSIRKVINNFVTSFGSAFGDMHARGQIDLMHSNLQIYELIVFSLVSIAYSVTFVMITPFAMVYTKGVDDVNYYQPLFGFIFTLSGAFNCYRIPYETIVKALGHYKQTRNGSFAEAIINIVVSVIFVIKFGLVGVAVGTLAATVFRTFQFSIYLRKNILVRSKKMFLKHLVLSFTVFILVMAIDKAVGFSVNNIYDWVLKAGLFTVASAIITVAINFVFYRKDMFLLTKKMKSVFSHNR